MCLRVVAWCLLTGLAGLAVAAEPAAPTKEEPAKEEPAKEEPATDSAAAAAADAAAQAAEEGGQSSPAAPTADAGREAEIAAMLPRLATDDELRWLEAGSTKFFAFSRKPKQGEPRGAILIVPAAGEFIDERALTRTLRSLPPAGGFATLALQPPLSPAVAPAAEAAVDAAAQTAVAEDPGAAASTPAAPESVAVHADFCPRIAAALAALEGAGAPLLAIAAAGDSVPAVLACYPDGLPSGVGAFAAIGGWQGSLAALKVPTIEFVPGRDPAAVAAANRREAVPLRDDEPPRRRVDLDGVDRSFAGADVEIAKRLRGWLERLPPPAADTAATAD